MPANGGSIIGGASNAAGRGFDLTIYYDASSSPVGPQQPLVNGPGGNCLEIANPDNVRGEVVFHPMSGAPDVTIAVGGLAGMLPTRNLLAMQLLGLFKRGDVRTYDATAFDD
jgi:hypothetical protein